MNMMRTRKPGFNRSALANQAMQAAITARAKAKVDQHSPICIYGLCETLGVAVRFNNINMEGMYQRGERFAYAALWNRLPTLGISIQIVCKLGLDR
jgi:hypothetical protein